MPRRNMSAEARRRGIKNFIEPLTYEQVFGIQPQKDKKVQKAKKPQTPTK